MTAFDPLDWDPGKAKAEIDAFAQFLGSPTREFGERDEVLPFFKAHRHLAGLIGTWNTRLRAPDVIRSELEFFGDHACDLAIGGMASREFCFVEFEDARPGSVFRPQKKNRSADWAARLEHGFGQILDWFRLLDDMRNTARFHTQFGDRAADYVGVLVIGRRAFLTPVEQARLRWRSTHVSVSGRRVECLTFDDLLDWCRYRLPFFVA